MHQIYVSKKATALQGDPPEKLLTYISAHLYAHGYNSESNATSTYSNKIGTIRHAGLVKLIREPTETHIAPHHDPVNTRAIPDHFPGLTALTGKIK
jgi:hypothetical protein